MKCFSDVYVLHKFTVWLDKK